MIAEAVPCAMHPVARGFRTEQGVVVADIQFRTLPPPPNTPPEKRGHPRVRGRQIKVHLADAEAKCILVDGWIMDRSHGGLGVSARESFPVGTVLHVRAAGVQEGRWIQVTVRNCRQVDQNWLIGVRFKRLPTWDEKLQFC